jgi:hypothetical protein
MRRRNTGSRGMRSDSGRRLNRLWKVGAKHALYRRTGNFYMPLERFPGALFDPNGYVLFETEIAFRACTHLDIGDRVHCRDGISKISSYIRMISKQSTTKKAIASPLLEQKG